MCAKPWVGSFSSYFSVNSEWAMCTVHSFPLCTSAYLRRWICAHATSIGRCGEERITLSFLPLATKFSMSLLYGRLTRFLEENPGALTVKQKKKMNSTCRLQGIKNGDCLQKMGASGPLTLWCTANTLYSIQPQHYVRCGYISITQSQYPADVPTLLISATHFLITSWQDYVILCFPVSIARSVAFARSLDQQNLHTPICEPTGSEKNDTWKIFIILIPGVGTASYVISILSIQLVSCIGLVIYIYIACLKCI